MVVRVRLMVRVRLGLQLGVRVRGVRWLGLDLWLG